MGEIYYVYPKWKNVSFTKIANAHIEQLKPKIKVQEIDEDVLDNLMWLRPRNILLHPVLYVTIGDKAGLFDARQKRLKSVLKVKGKLGGFETSDSDELSKKAINTINSLDVLFLPSHFAVKVFKKSGAKVPLHRIPHGISDVMCSPNRNITNPTIQEMLKLKKRKGAILILYFLLHSKYRKGADLAYEALRFIQEKHKDFYLVLKGGGGNDIITRRLKTLRCIEINTWMAEDVLKQLYDVCDMLIVPSRGGGFELNALEGMARALPTIVPNAGCFKDYTKYAISLPITKHPTVFPDNPIHIGKGWEVSIDDLALAMEKVINDLDGHKEMAMNNSKIIQKEYNWQRIGLELFKHIQNYGFCD